MLKKLFSLSTSGSRTVGLDILRTVTIMIILPFVTSIKNIKFTEYNHSNLIDIVFYVFN